MKRKRTLSRLMASQALYQFFYFKQERKIEEIAEGMIDEYSLEDDEEIGSYRKKIDVEMFQNLCSGSLMALDKIDETIKEFLKTGWEIENLDEILLQIIRLGTFELMTMKDVPYKVVIDQYVDIAASFFDGKKITFANAILEAIAKKFRFEEIEKLKLKNE